MLAEIDNGAGPGVYRKGEVPDQPVHPNCLCDLIAYYGETPGRATFATVKKYLNEQDDRVRAAMIGKANAASPVLYQRALDRRGISFEERTAAQRRRIPDELLVERAAVSDGESLLGKRKESQNGIWYEDKDGILHEEHDENILQFNTAKDILSIPQDEERDAFEKRFGNKFTEFYNKSMEYIDSDAPIPDDVRKELEMGLKAHGKTLDGFLGEVDDFIKSGNVVRHDVLDNFLNNIDNFEKDPRIMTQFETRNSQGAYYPEARNYFERRLIGQVSEDRFDYATDIEKTNYGIADRHRPVYAEVTRFHPLDDNADSYGDIAFVFSEDAKSRASFTLDNSSEDGLGSFKNKSTSIFSKPGVDVSKNYGSFYNSQRKGHFYVEAQVWGGIDVREGDLKAVVMEDKTFDKRKTETSFLRFLDVMKNNKVSVIKRSDWRK
jgi:hypothetical protein